MAYTEEQNKTIKDLHNRAADLGEGIDIDITFKIDEGARLEWSEGTEYTEIDICDNNHCFWESVKKQYEKQMKDLRKEFQAKIDAVIKESEDLAKEVGEDPDEFFDNNICA